MATLFVSLKLTTNQKYMANLQHLEKELWIDIPGYEGYYQASTFGNIRSMPRIKNILAGTCFVKCEY